MKYIVVTLCAVTIALCQSVQTYRVLLRDKGPGAFLPGSNLYQATVALHTPRSLARRAKVLPPDSLLMWADAPLYPPYLEDIQRTGARILLTLRWRNYAVVECDSVIAYHLRTKPYVLAVQPTSSVLRPMHIARSWLEQNTLFDYGSSLLQLQMLHAPEMHQLGIAGENVLVGLIDTGFRWHEHEALRNSRVLGEYDFIQLDTITANQEGDHEKQDGHGTAVMSVLVGLYPDSLLGIAPCCSVILAKTENIASERRIEEDAYAAAVEWMEAHGADIISSSLGYYKFDSTEVPYEHTDLDGKTTIVARTLCDATRRGVLCVTAAGNDGDQPRSIFSPGDADSAITVGAVSDALFNVPRFTSRGPTVDGRLKPNLAALGVNVRTASTASPSALGWSSGTSMSTPLIAGSAALLLQAYPSLTPWQLRQLLEQNASHAREPNYAIGYGVPDVLLAALRWDILCSPPIVIPTPDSLTIGIAARSLSPITDVTLILQMFDGQHTFSLQPYQYVWVITLPRTALEGNDSIQFAFVLRDRDRTRRYPESNFFAVQVGDTLLPCGWNAYQLHLLSVTQLRQNERHSAVAIPHEQPLLPIPQSVAQHLWSGERIVCRIYDVTLRPIGTLVLEAGYESIHMVGLTLGSYLVVFECAADGRRVSQLVLVY